MTLFGEKSTSFLLFIQTQILADTLLTINSELGLDPAESSHLGKNTDFETLSGPLGALLIPPHRNRLSTPGGFLHPRPTGTMATVPQRPRRQQQQHQSTHQQSLLALTTSSPLQQDKARPGGSIDTEPSASQEKDGEHSAAIFFLSGCV